MRAAPLILASCLIASIAAPVFAQAGGAARPADIVVIPEGWFVMGSDDGPPDERPQRQVWLGAFAIDRYEVTNDRYRAFLLASGRAPPPYWKNPESPFRAEYPEGTGAFPVVGVTWEDAAAYCTWAGGRLPTEAEWEKAARGIDGRIYPWGDDWDPSKANVDSGSGAENDGDYLSKDAEYAWSILAAGVGAEAGLPRLAPVGSYPSGTSPWGLFDMEGNAAEWVADWYNWEGYANLPDHDPFVDSPPWNRCFRGSAWFNPYAISRYAAALSRCSARNSSHASRDPRVGFRCAYDIASPGP